MPQEKRAVFLGLQLEVFLPYDFMYKEQNIKIGGISFFCFCFESIPSIRLED